MRLLDMRRACRNVIETCIDAILLGLAQHRHRIEACRDARHDDSASISMTQSRYGHSRMTKRWIIGTDVANSNSSPSSTASDQIVVGAMPPPIARMSMLDPGGMLRITASVPALTVEACANARITGRGVTVFRRAPGFLWTYQYSGGSRPGCLTLAKS